MKIEPNERIKSGGEYRPANQVCDVPEGVGKDLIARGKAKPAAGRPATGQSGGSKKPTAAELVAEIADMEDVDRLQELAEDSRKTVSDAACARLDEIEAGDSGDDDQGGTGDSGDSAGGVAT